MKKELSDFQVKKIKDLIDQGRESYTPAKMLAVIEFARKMKFTPNQLHTRIINQPGSASVDVGWITEADLKSSRSSSVDTQSHYHAKEAAQQRSKQQADAEAVERKQAHQRRRLELEEQFGARLDVMTEEERDALLSRFNTHTIQFMTPEIKRTNQLQALFELSKAQAAGG